MTTVNDIDDIETGVSNITDTNPVVTTTTETTPASTDTTPTSTESSEDVYVPEFTEQVEDTPTPLVTPTDVKPVTTEIKIQTPVSTPSEVEVLNSIATKFGLEGTYNTVEDLNNALFEKKVDTAFEASSEVRELSRIIQSESAEEIVRYQLTTHKQQYGILSNADLERRITGYQEDGELENIAEDIKAGLEKRLGELYSQTKTNETQKSADAAKVATEIFEVQNKIKTTIDNYNGSLKSFIKETDLKAISYDTKQYILSGKYVEDAWGEKNLTDMNALVENAMWVNPKIRAYLISAIAKEAVKRGESNFIKEHLFGKNVSVASATTMVGGTTKYINEL